MTTKLLVFAIFVFESLQTLLLTHDAFGAFGAGWGNLEALSNVQWLGLTIPIMSGVSESYCPFHFDLVAMLFSSELHGSDVLRLEDI